MKLTEHFNLSEFTNSQISSRMGFDNSVPDDKILNNLKRLAKGMELVRNLLNNNPIHISSGYRCKDLNDYLGSKETSRHRTGNACDFSCFAYGSNHSVFQDISESSIFFDQLILEYYDPNDKYSGWIHISFPEENEQPRRQILTIDKTGAKLINENTISGHRD